MTWKTEHTSHVYNYQNSTSLAERNKIFNNDLYVPLKSMVTDIVKSFYVNPYSDNTKDIVSDTVCFLYDRLNSTKITGSTFSYLYKHARNHIVDNFRKQNTREKYFYSTNTFSEDLYYYEPTHNVYSDLVKHLDEKINAAKNKRKAVLTVLKDCILLGNFDYDEFETKACNTVGINKKAVELHLRVSNITYSILKEFSKN